MNDGSAQVVNGTTISGMERLLITTGSGDDYIESRTYNLNTANYISTGAGNDTLAGENYAATLDGGSGDDTFNNIISGYIEGGEGNDTVTIDYLGSSGNAISWVGQSRASVNAESTSFAIASLLRDSSWLSVPDGAGRSLILSGVENLSILHGGSGDDLIFALGNGTTYDGGSGKDTFYANWSTATNNITWVNDGSAQVVNGTTISGMERLLITTGSGDDYIDNHKIINFSTDTIYTGAGNDTLIGGGGNNLLSTGTGQDTVVIDGHGFDTVTDFSSGLDQIKIGFSVGNKDGVIDTATITADHFNAASELVIFTTDVEDDTISARSAAAAIGSADSAYTSGQSAIFVVDNGVDSQIYRFLSSGNDALVSASELTLLATLSGTASTALTDYAFGG